MFFIKNKYFISIFLLAVFVTLIILGIFFFERCNDTSNVILRIAIAGAPYCPYEITVTKKGKVTATAGHAELLSWQTYTHPFVTEVRFSYETTLSESELNDILAFADKACAESSKIEKSLVQFEDGAEEVYIMYKDYRINHYINVGNDGVQILDAFMKMFTEKIDFVYITQAGLWKIAR